MTKNFDLKASIRQDKGKGASRRLRHGNKIPAVMYGAGKEAVSLVMDHGPLMHSLENEAFYSHILNIDIDGTVEKAVLKDLQRHPFKQKLLHADFQRVSATEKLRMHVPLHFVGAEVAPGIKTGGGVASHLINDVEISCLPQDLPEFIEVDVSAMELNETLHLSDLKLSAGVELMALSQGVDHDLPVISVHLLRGAVEEVEPGTTSEEGEAESEGGEGE